MPAMRTDLSRPWSAGDLSAVTDLSQSQTRRLFRRHLRASPRQWLLRERLMFAQSLIIENGAPARRDRRDLRLLRRLPFQSRIQALGGRLAGRLAAQRIGRAAVPLTTEVETAALKEGSLANPFRQPLCARWWSRCTRSRNSTPKMRF
jgi:AraC-like DNA-binding protein